jgi:hypothetical protein
MAWRRVAVILQKDDYFFCKKFYHQYLREQKNSIR